MCKPRCASFSIGEWRCCTREAGTAVDQEARDGCDVGLDDTQRADAVDPHHGGGGIADDAACAAGIGGRNDGGKVTDMYFAPEHVPRHGAADQGGGNIVEETRHHEYNGKQNQAAAPAVWQQRRHRVRDSAVLEMP